MVDVVCDIGVFGYLCVVVLNVDVFVDGFEVIVVVNGGMYSFVVDSGSELMMGDEISVLMDRGCEVCVDFGCKIIVVEFGVCLGVGVEIFGIYYVLCGEDMDKGVEEWIGRVDVFIERVSKGFI